MPGASRRAHADHLRVDGHHAIAGGMVFAFLECDVQRCLTLVLGVLIGQWLAFGAAMSPADLHAVGMAAWDRRDYAEALRVWSHAATMQPDNPIMHFRRATALAELGQQHAAADAFRLALILEPPPAVAELARSALSRLEAPVAAIEGGDTTVMVEPSRGVWVASVVLNGERKARFLVDTGSSVTVIAPALAETLGLRGEGAETTVELQTLAGLTVGPVVTLSSLRLGGAEIKDVAVVIHDPGPAVDGILGNTFLNRYRVTLDADRRLLHLKQSN
jgi:clan AA aspartic protease (TIGR02281 family)